MAAEFAHHRETLRLGVLLDGMADIAQRGAIAHLFDAFPHAVVGDVGQAARQDRGLAHVIHAAGIAEPAILDDGDVDVERIAVLEHLVARYAMTDLVVDRGADGAGEGRVAGWGVAYGGRLDLQFVGQVGQAQLVQLARRDAWFDVRRNEVEDFGGVLAGGAHFGQIGRIGNDAHVSA
ncbi:Uncharacterised protein [Bordetella pertussis]|nr:Uncharacterised protein [Bordetella pertussis]